MWKTKQRPVCKTPDLCVIACPYNRVLDQMYQPVCELEPIAEDDIETIEVAFRDSPRGNESD